MHKSVIAWLIFAVWMIISQPIANANTPQEVHVALFQAHPNVQSVIIQGPLEIVQPAGQTLNVQAVVFGRAGERIEGVIQQGTRFSVTPFAVAARFVVRGTSGVTVVVPSGMHSRSYKGKIVIAVHPDGGSTLVAPSPRGLYLTNIVPTRDYIKSVVGSETSTGFAPECLKAQSVLAQNVLERNHGEVILDTTQDQAYLGYDAVRPDIDAAVDATWGMLLRYHGKPAVPFYHSTCAGGTSDGKRYFALKGDLPYLKGTVCSYCHDSPFWKTTTALVPLSVWQTKIGETEVPTVLAKDDRKRPTSIRLGAKVVSGYLFWLQLGQKLGWDKAPGTRFDIRQQGSNVLITSTGAGHGVGLCQWGANGLARRGKSFRDILNFYFPGTEVKTPQTAQ